MGRDTIGPSTEGPSAGEPPNRRGRHRDGVGAGNVSHQRDRQCIETSNSLFFRSTITRNEPFVSPDNYTVESRDILSYGLEVLLYLGELFQLSEERRRRRRDEAQGNE